LLDPSEGYFSRNDLLNVMGVEASYRDEAHIVHEGIRRLSAFFEEMGLPQTLSELGIHDDSNFEIMAKKATKAAYGQEFPIGGLKKLYWQDVVKIYQDCV
jgi:alcohol dehydrogenase YqhD (iron-dependent ADH family)